MASSDEALAWLRQRGLATDHASLNKLRASTNPDGKPIGHYTGRCGICGSADLWDDMMHYGCNHCHSFWCF